MIHERQQPKTVKSSTKAYRIAKSPVICFHVHENRKGVSLRLKSLVQHPTPFRFDHQTAAAIVLLFLFPLVVTNRSGTLDFSHIFQVHSKCQLYVLLHLLLLSCKNPPPTTNNKTLNHHNVPRAYHKASRVSDADIMSEGGREKRKALSLSLSLSQKKRTEKGGSWTFHRRRFSFFFPEKIKETAQGGSLLWPADSFDCRTV